MNGTVGRRIEDGIVSRYGENIKDNNYFLINVLVSMKLLINYHKHKEIEKK